MLLKQQILNELKEQNNIMQAEIQKCEEQIKVENFAMSTVTGGVLSGSARSACESRLQVANSKKRLLERENSWIKEMLEKYQ